MDPQEGGRYIEPMKDEVGRSWDHTCNIFENYIHPTVDGEIGWRSASSGSSNSNDALENWQNRLHEVSFRKCGLITSLFSVLQLILSSFPFMKDFPDYQSSFKNLKRNFLNSKGYYPSM